MKNPDHRPEHGRFDCAGNYRRPDGTVIHALDCGACGGTLPDVANLSYLGYVCPPCHAELPDIGGG